MPDKKIKSTSDSIIAMIDPLYENWKNKPQNDRKVARAETKNYCAGIV